LTGCAFENMQVNVISVVDDLQFLWVIWYCLEQHPFAIWWKNVWFILLLYLFYVSVQVCLLIGAVAWCL